MKKSIIAQTGEMVEVEFTKVDFSKDSILESVTDIAENMPIVATKTREVKARGVVLGENVVTMPLATIDGKVCGLSETQQIVTEEHVARGDMVVTNPDGETYIVKGPKFQKLYAQTGEGVYKPQGEAKIFVTATQDICFMTSWGEMQFSPKGSKLCISDLSDIYSVTDIAFGATYEEKELSKDEANKILADVYGFENNGRE